MLEPLVWIEFLITTQLLGILDVSVAHIVTGPAQTAYGQFAEFR